MPSEASAGLTPHESPPLVDRDSVGQRINVLAQKFGLENCLGNRARVVEITSSFIDKYQLPEAFLDDDLNLGLLVGSAQKLSENTDPLYRQRIENFVDCLVEPVAAPGTTTVAERWEGGLQSGPDPGSRVIEYAQSHFDPDLSKQIGDKYASNIKESTAIWGLKGYELEVEILVVNQNLYEFKVGTGGAGGMVSLPGKEEMATAEGKKVVRIIFPEDLASNEELMAHEIYHIRDKFDYTRRGFNGRIFENIDELHTEFGCGNYREGPDGENKNEGAYSEIKDFWHKITQLTDLDPSLLGNRQQLLTNIIQEFGFEGIVDLGLLSSRDGRSAAEFETTFPEHNRAVAAMLVSKEKVRLRKNSGEKIRVEELANSVTHLNDWLKPDLTSSRPHYRRLFDLIPDVYSDVYSSFLDNDTLPKIEETKQIISDYFTSIAYFELQSTGEIGAQDNDQLLLDSIGKVHYGRSEIKYDYLANIEYNLTEDEDENIGRRYHNVRVMPYSLTSDLKGIDFVFGLRNENVRQGILNDFNEELYQSFQFCLENDWRGYIDAFIEGIYQYPLPHELREHIADYLKENYPQLAEFIEEQKTMLDSQNSRSVSL